MDEKEKGPLFHPLIHKRREARFLWRDRAKALIVYLPVICDSGHCPARVLVKKHVDLTRSRCLEAAYAGLQG